MAQLRKEYEKFVALDTEVVVVGPENQRAFEQYWEKEDLPFIGLADPTHKVAKTYGQEVKLLKFGRMPAMMVIDKQGIVQFRHYGGAMQDIPPNAQILGILRKLNQGEIGVE